MQDDKAGGVTIRTVKSFLSKIPSVITGADIVQWLMKSLNIEDQGEAIHLGSLIAAQGYLFPISDHVLTLKDDGTFYRFQAPYFWPSNCWEPENTDYAIYLCKRTMQNKARLELADYEAENLARLQRAFARKWEFIFMQAEAQVKIDRKKDKTERKILDSQERAFWDVHRPVPGCVNTTEMDIRKCRRMKNPNKVKKSVYGVPEDSQTHSPIHSFASTTKQPAKDDLKKQITLLNIQLDRHCLKMSKVAERFWSAAEDLKKRPLLEVPDKVQETWQEFLAPGAPSAINLDSHSYEITSQNVKDPGRYTFEDAQEHIYKLMKSDSYARFLRSNAYQELLQARKKGKSLTAKRLTGLMQSS
ncbi:regulator of G-protein signaling 6 isoform X7 [Hemiscyllium ocellatum]|uniref:regulator of G-protein signaling 6 isoform X7 n=1 Tax=Hemiscyllium ocellatum TaxID=170820 RepID=UPI0029671DCE|nr:regulator of G-protein signaling 6 isoform X7 [Hemiscyllium ocellatum]